MVRRPTAFAKDRYHIALAADRHEANTGDAQFSRPSRREAQSKPLAASLVASTRVA
jgi:hypothetical protein